jgi:hypothetical protein
MRRQRYMIVEHSSEKEASKHFNDMVVPIHTMLATYHWARLDDSHVFLTGYYEISMHDRLHQHPKVSVLPSASSAKTLNAHLTTKNNHWQALSRKLSLDSSATTQDAIEAAESMFGAVFSLEK